MHLFPLLAVFVGGEVVDMISNTGAVAKLVLLVLLAFSLISWAIILTKWNLLRRARTQSGRLVRAFRKAQRLQDIAAVADQFKPSPLVGVFEGGYEEYRRQIGATGALRNPALDSAWHADRRIGGNHAPRAQSAVARDYGCGHAVRRIVRHGLGHHRRIPRTRHRGRGDSARGCAGNFGSSDHYCCRIGCRHSRRHRLQPDRCFDPRIRRTLRRLLRSKFLNAVEHNQPQSSAAVAADARR